MSRAAICANRSNRRTKRHPQCQIVIPQQPQKRMEKTCRVCGESEPGTREYFGGTPSGGLKGRCRACEREASRLFEINNKDRRRARDDKRAAASGGIRQSFNLSTKLELFRKQNGYCLCCMKQILSPEEGEVDHARPLVKGDREDKTNRFLAHAQCNREKHNKTLREHWEWRVRNGLDEENVGGKFGLLEYFPD